MNAFFRNREQCFGGPSATMSSESHRTDGTIQVDPGRRPYSAAFRSYSPDGSCQTGRSSRPLGANLLTLEFMNLYARLFESFPSD